MFIKIFLRPNLVSSNPNEYSARVDPNAVLNSEDLLLLMKERGTTVTEPDMRATLALFYDVVVNQVVRGSFVNLPIANFKPGVKGVFTSDEDGYDASRHTIKANISAGVLLNQKLTTARINKIEKPERSPFVRSFLDIHSNTVKTQLTAGGIGQITGNELKFDPNNANEGVYFIANDDTETKVLHFSDRTDSKLVFTIPSTLTPGTYKVQVRRIYNQQGDVVVGILILIQLTTCSPLSIL